MLRLHRHNLMRPMLLCAVLICGIPRAQASIVSFFTPSGSNTGGQPVNAKVTFTTGTDALGIFLENLQADPRSVTQCLSGIRFAISSGQTSASLSSSSGTERTVFSNGTFSNGPTVATGWELSTVGSELKLTMLGTHMAPDHTIIGPPAASGLYSNANPSITNGVHSPFLGLSATFNLNVPGITAASTINSTMLLFNTSAGNEVAAVVPEPAAGILAVVALGALARRRR